MDEELLKLDELIPQINLSPWEGEELIDQTLIRIQEASGNTLTDFRPGTAIRSLIEGQVFAIEELLWLLQWLPSATALEIFRVYGITRLPGRRAKGEFQVLLKTPLTTEFILPSGYEIPYGEGFFTTDSQLVIPAGVLMAPVVATASIEGDSMNVPALGLYHQPNMAYLEAIYNDVAIVGGASIEPLEDFILRGQRKVRNREVLISPSDYENAALEILGGGKVVCIPRLSSDRLSYAVGQVHLFLSYPDAGEVPAGICNDVKLQLSRQIFAGSDLWVSPMEFLYIIVEVVVDVPQVSNTTANSIASQLYSYILNLSPGSTVRVSELAYVVRNTPTVTGIDVVLIDGNNINTAMPNDWTQPVLDTAIITLVQPGGINETYTIGYSDRGDL